MPGKRTGLAKSKPKPVPKHRPSADAKAFGAKTIIFVSPDLQNEGKKPKAPKQSVVIKPVPQKETLAEKRARQKSETTQRERSSLGLKMTGATGKNRIDVPKGKKKSPAFSLDPFDRLFGAGKAVGTIGEAVGRGAAGKLQDWGTDITSTILDEAMSGGGSNRGPRSVVPAKVARIGRASEPIARPIRVTSEWLGSEKGAEDVFGGPALPNLVLHGDVPNSARDALGVGLGVSTVVLSPFRASRAAVAGAIAAGRAARGVEGAAKVGEAAAAAYRGPGIISKAMAARSNAKASKAMDAWVKNVNDNSDEIVANRDGLAKAIKSLEGDTSPEAVAAVKAWQTQHDILEDMLKQADAHGTPRLRMGNPFAFTDAEKATSAKRALNPKPLEFANGRLLDEHGLPFVGDITPSEAVKRIILATPSRAQRAHDADFYNQVYPTLSAIFNDREIMAWLASQVGASPGRGVLDLLRVLDHIKAGTQFPKTGKGSIGLAAQGMRKILEGETSLSQGAAAKISDFVDSGLLRSKRNFTGGAKGTGAPAVADRWGARSRGLVDQDGVKQIKARFGIDVQQDMAAGLTENQYENVAKFYQDMADEMNAGKGFDGRKDWSAIEVQAMDWAAIQRYWGVEPEDLRFAIDSNTRMVNLELTHGVNQLGSDLTLQERVRLNKMMEPALRASAARYGLRVTSYKSGVSANDGPVNVSTHIGVLRAPEHDVLVKAWINDLAAQLNQHTVWATKPGTSGGRVRVAIRITAPGLANPKTEAKFWNALREEAPELMGYAPFTRSTGEDGISIITNKGYKDGQSAAEAAAHYQAAVNKAAKVAGLKKIDYDGASTSILIGDGSASVRASGDVSGVRSGGAGSKRRLDDPSDPEGLFDLLESSIRTIREGRRRGINVPLARPPSRRLGASGFDDVRIGGNRPSKVPVRPGEEPRPTSANVPAAPVVRQGGNVTVRGIPVSVSSVPRTAEMVDARIAALENQFKKAIDHIAEGFTDEGRGVGSRPSMRSQGKEASSYGEREQMIIDEWKDQEDRARRGLKIRGRRYGSWEEMAIEKYGAYVDNRGSYKGFDADNVNRKQRVKTDWTPDEYRDAAYQELHAALTRAVAGGDRSSQRLLASLDELESLKRVRQKIEGAALFPEDMPPGGYGSELKFEPLPKMKRRAAEGYKPADLPPSALDELEGFDQGVYGEAKDLKAALPEDYPQYNAKILGEIRQWDHLDDALNDFEEIKRTDYEKGPDGTEEFQGDKADAWEAIKDEHDMYLEGAEDDLKMMLGDELGLEPIPPGTPAEARAFAEMNPKASWPSWVTKSLEDDGLLLPDGEYDGIKGFKMDNRVGGISVGDILGSKPKAIPSGKGGDEYQQWLKDNQGRYSSSGETPAPLDLPERPTRVNIPAPPAAAAAPPGAPPPVDPPTSGGLWDEPTSDGPLEGPQTDKEFMREGLKGARRVRKDMEASWSPDRKARQRAGDDAYDEVIRNGGTAEEALKAKMGELKGKYAQIDFHGFTELNDDAFNYMLNFIQKSNLMGWERTRAQLALRRAREGRVPTNAQLDLFEQLFGKETADGIAETSTRGRILNAAIGIANIPRTLMATADVSAPLRQAITAFGRHPIIAGKNLVPMFKAMKKSEYDDLFDDIDMMDTRDYMERAKLDITDLDSDLKMREESFQSPLLDRAWIVSHSGRAYTGFLSKTRADIFEHQIKRAIKKGVDVERPGFLEDLGEHVNTITGRGKIPTETLRNSAAAMNAMFFSPKLMASRIQMLNIQYYWKLDPYVRKEALRASLQTIGMATSVLGLAYAVSQYPGADVDVGLDPRSSDFGKIRIGDTRIDIGGGFLTYLIFATRMITGQSVSSSSGETQDIGWNPANRLVEELYGEQDTDAEGNKNRLDVAWRFAQSKFSPPAGITRDLIAGETFMGDPLKLLGWDGMLANYGVPLNVQGGVDTGMNEGSIAAGIAAGFLGSTGIGLASYPDKEPSSSSDKSKWQKPGGSSGSSGGGSSDKSTWVKP